MASSFILLHHVNSFTDEYREPKLCQGRTFLLPIASIKCVKAIPVISRDYNTDYYVGTKIELSNSVDYDRIGTYPKEENEKDIPNFLGERAIIETVDGSTYIVDETVEALSGRLNYLTKTENS